MADLRPLAEELAPASRELAEALRDLFRGLQVSVRRYAARRHRDAGTFSRYLSGTRTPPWEVVNDLLTDLGAHLGRPLTASTVGRIKLLHRAAVETTSSPRHALEVLSQQLAEADRSSRRSSVHGDALEEALLDRGHRIADLENRLNQLEADWATERDRADQLEQDWGEAAELRRERDALVEEIARMETALLEAQRRREAAEARCILLERQLEVVEQRAAVAEAPTEPPPAPVPANPLPAETPRRPLGRLPRILIVDDQPSNTLALHAVLADLGQELVVAHSGRDALKELLQDDDFAVILLDVQMPEMDGYETAAHIKRRRRTRDIPIIFLTAMGSSSEHTARGYAAGAVDYIGKPYDPWVVRAKVSVFTDLFLERRQGR